MKGSVSKRADSWQYMFDIGRDGTTGKRRRKSKGGFKTKKECEIALAKAIAEFENAGSIESSYDYLSVSEFLAIWLKDVKLKRRHRSYLNYESVVRNHIDPLIGHYYIKNVNPMTIKSMFDKKFKDKDMTEELMSTIYKVLSIAFKKAVIPYGIIKDNPVQYVKVSDYTFPDKEERDILTKDNALTILNYLNKKYRHTYFIVFAIAFHMGMRRGEILGLQIEDVNFNDNTIRINKQSYYDKKTGIQLVDLKTKASRRTIYMPKQLVDILRQHIDYLESTNVNHTFLCVNSKCRPLHSDNVSWILKKINKHFEFNNLRLHDYRGLHATLLVELGADYKSIQERLGHVDLKTTMRQYVKQVTDKTSKKTISLWEHGVL